MQYKSLQFGRAIAAILVVLFHLGGAISADKYFGIEMFSIPFSFGGAGVEFFFVLSGFIIYSAHRRDTANPSMFLGFVKKRIIRIYPTYLIIFIAVYLMALASPSLRDSVPHDFFLILKSLFLMPQDKNVIGGTGAPVLIVAWSLQYEMLFYFFFALLIINKWLLLLSTVSLVCFFALDVLSPFLQVFLFHQFILLFLMGVCISILCTSNLKVHKPLFYVLAGLILFLLVAFDTIFSLNIFGGEKILLYGFASSLIIVGLVKSEEEGNMIGGHRWFQILGDSSYALYLIHFPMISILCKFFMLMNLNQLGIAGAFISYIVIFTLCLISSVIFHLLVEKPVVRYLRNWRNSQVKVA